MVSPSLDTRAPAAEARCPMHLLLCGHGYLGQAISRDFLAAGWQVTPVSRTAEAADEIACDLSSAGEVAALATTLPRPDRIIHCASSSRGGPDAYRSVYLDGCRNLLDAFPESRLIFTSSSSVYAQTDGSVITEESPATPDRETGRILREAEELVLASGGIAARLSGIYGPHRSVILRRFLAGEAAIEEDGRRFLNQIHRDDASAALLRLSANDAHKGIFNLTDSRPLTQLECYTGLSQAFDLPLPPSGPRDPDRKRGWTHKRVSNEKLKATGWEPRFTCFLDAVASIAPTIIPAGGR